MKKHYAVCQVSEFLNIGTRAVGQLIRSGLLQGYQFGSEVRVRESDLIKFLENSKIEKTKIEKKGE